MTAAGHEVALYDLGVVADGGLEVEEEDPLRLAAGYHGSRVTLDVPMTMLGGDALVDLALIVGTIAEATDVVPNAGVVRVGPGSGPGFAPGSTLVYLATMAPRLPRSRAAPSFAWMASSGNLPSLSLTTASDSYIRQTFLRTRRSVDEGLVSEAEYLHSLAEREGASVMTDPPGTYLEPVGEAIPPSFMEEFLLVPFARPGTGPPSVAIARELDPATRRELAAVLGEAPALVVADKATVLGLIDALYRGRDGLVEGVEVEGRTASGVEVSEEARDLANQPPVIRLVNFLIHEAHRKGASDIHLEALEDELKVRYRVDGTLHDITHPPKRYQAAILSRIKILADLDITERRRPQDGRLRTRIDDHAVDLRISTVPTLHGESVVIRLLDQETLRLPLDELGFDAGTLAGFRRRVEAPNGIVLVTGPTGSGKTTTLYAALARRNRPEVKIVTIEDPVEYQLAGVNQVHVRPDIGLTFAHGLRSLLRQDPDILMVGEMRDFETAAIAIQAALTGHLVFSTLHTNDAPGSVTRLLEMGVEDYLVASTVTSILAQRLVRRVCRACAVAVDARALGPAERALLGPPDGAWRLRRGTGCEACDATGYRGRTGIFELLLVDEAIRQAIADHAPVDRLRALALEGGMRTLREDGLRKAREGVTTVEEVLRVTGEEEANG
ncbi:MAG: GspE/PulE family protein [Gemmatimonadota bacterium]